MGTNNATTDYTIISKPVYVQFECPHCYEDIEYLKPEGLRGYEY